MPVTKKVYTNKTTGKTVAAKGEKIFTKLPASTLTPSGLRERLAQHKEEASALKELYAALFLPELMLDDLQFGQWVRQYGFDHAVPALDAVAQKNNTINQMLDEGRTTDDEGKPLERMQKLNIVKLASWIMSQGIDDDRL